MDRIAEVYKDNGSFKILRDIVVFQSLCISPNDQVVHGIPNDKVLIDGDILSVDCGVLMTIIMEFLLHEVGKLVKI